MIGDQTIAESLRIAERHLIKQGWKFGPADVAKEANKIIEGIRASMDPTDRQTVEQVLEPDDLLPSYCRLLDAMQGDDPDAVDSAFHASIEAVSKFGLLRASMDPNHVR